MVVPGGFAVNPSTYPELPFDTVKDFAPVSVLAEGPPHLATELFKLMTNTQIHHIPYKGAGPAAVDLFAGQIPI